jgi:hypothetical protein
MDDDWILLDEFVQIKSPWLTLIGEKFKDNQGKIVDYWRIEKQDSVIIITSYQDRLVFPRPIFRPGVGKKTLDFAGGRVIQRKSIKESALLILSKELGLSADDLDFLEPINSQGWEINSSFNNQKLWGFFAQINHQKILNWDLIGTTYQLNEQGIKELLQDLTCLQCRSLFREWLSDSYFLLAKDNQIYNQPL